ncbi:MAG: glycosyltransferase family 39 protein, partial [Chloroflexi bacterium]|nr:glycosyltransferase family 39 protein [Chloroflexota bacterium]
MDAASVAARPAPSITHTSVEFLRKRALLLALASLLIIALGLRLYGINWDDGADFSLHPDERSIVWTAQQLSPGSLTDPLELFDVDVSSLVPRSPNQTSGHGVYDYGSLPFYVLASGSWLIGLLPGVDDTDMYTMTIIGRAMSAILDTGTVLLVFLIGRRLFRTRVGLLAAVFTTFAVLHIQLSHFYTTEAMLTFFSVLSFFFLVRVAGEGRRRDAVFAGIAFGLALATKFSAAPMLVGVAAAPALYALRGDEDRVGPWAFDPQRLKPALKLLGIMVGLMALTFVVTQPYAILDIRYYAADAYSQSEMVRRIIDFPFTRQYDNSLPFLYHIWQFSIWGVGLPLGVLMWGGLAFSAAVALFRRSRADLLLMAWVLPFFLITGFAEVKFLRYLLPITPFLAIMAARSSLTGLSWLKGRRFIKPALPHRAGAAILGLVIFATVFYAFAFANVYTDTHPAVQVSNYVKSRVPSGTVLADEHWEESLPGLYSYPRVKLQLYDSDEGLVSYTNYRGRQVTGVKAEHLADQLAHTDYLVLFSNRLYGTIPRLPERYPLSSRYYQLLFDGDLGFDVEFVGQAYPNFLGVSFVNDTFTRPGLTPPRALASIQPTPITLDLGYADDSFVNYEHPMTILFKKARPLSEEELRTILEDEPKARRRGGVLASPLLEGGEETGQGILSPEDARKQQEGGTFSELFDRNSFSNRAPWLVWFVTVQFIALVTFPAGFLLFRRLPDRGYLLIKVLGLLLVGYLTWLMASLQWLPFSRGTLWLSILVVGLASAAALTRVRADIIDFVRRRWRFILLCEALFLVAFLAFYGIRAWSPDLWHPARGGEKPMDFAYLNAVTKSTYMPAYDPWFGGGYLNYYYFGQFQIASLIKLTGILPSKAFNLAIPLLFALTIGGAFSVVYNLAASHGTRDDRGPPRKRFPPIAAGLMGSLFVAVMGNLDGLVQVVQGVWRVTFQGLSFQGFDFWRSSRMIDTAVSPTDCGGCEITEFPFFSFLFADLHAHLIALPFAILAIGIGLSLVLGAKHPSDRWLRLLGLGALALTVGALFTINSWDYPTYIVFGAVVFFLALYLGRRRLSLGMVTRGVLGVGALVVVSFLLLLPFHLNYQGSVGFPWITRTEFTTPLYQYLGIHGIFIFIVLSYLLHRLHQTYGVFSWRSTGLRALATGSAGRLLYLRDSS